MMIMTGYIALFTYSYIAYCLLPVSFHLSLYVSLYMHIHRYRERAIEGEIEIENPVLQPSTSCCVHLSAIMVRPHNDFDTTSCA